MPSISTISQMSRYEQMQYYRERRKAAYAQFQQFSNQAANMMSVKTSESRGLGELAAKMGYQRAASKVSKTA